MSNAKVETTGMKKEVVIPKIPSPGFSRFSGNKGGFSAINNQKFNAKAQFTPPTIRVTQNKGGGGK